METIKVAGIQMGPYAGDYESNMNNALATLDKVVNEFKPDIVCFSELMTTPYFACVYDDSWLQHAEPIPGRTTNIIVDAAKKYGIHIIATVCEKSEDKYYNSAFLVSPTGELKGVYRKVHIPKSGDRKLIPIDEQYYFSPGDSFPVFDVEGVPIGILICFDRSITESFRVLMLKGAKVVFLPVATFGIRKDPFLEELKVRGMENHLFIVAVNKAGDEICEGEEAQRHHFGRSCIIDPMGSILVSLEDEPFGVLTGTIELSAIDRWVGVVDWRAHRRPELYDVLVKT